MTTVRIMIDRRVVSRQPVTDLEFARQKILEMLPELRLAGPVVLADNDNVTKIMIQAGGAR